MHTSRYEGTLTIAITSVNSCGEVGERVRACAVECPHHFSMLSMC
jgi:hypothetical protein